MRVALGWLAELIDVPPADALAERLTTAGIEIESIERTGPDLSQVIVGHVVAREKRRRRAGGAARDRVRRAQRRRGAARPRRARRSPAARRIAHQEVEDSRRRLERDDLLRARARPR
jgi:hypothetical protein